MTNREKTATKTVILHVLEMRPVIIGSMGFGIIFNQWRQGDRLGGEGPIIPERKPENLIWIFGFLGFFLLFLVVFIFMIYRGVPPPVSDNSGHQVGEERPGNPETPPPVQEHTPTILETPLSASEDTLPVSESLPHLHQVNGKVWGLVQGMVFRPGEGKVHLWTETGIRVMDGKGQFRKGYSGPIRGIFYSQNGKIEVILFGNRPNEIMVNHQWVKVPHVAEPGSGSLSPEGAFLVLGDQSSAQLVDLSKAEVSFVLDHEGLVQGLSFSPDGTHLAVGLSPTMDADSVFYPLRVWDFKQRKVLFDVSESTVGVQALAYSPDGRLIATADWDKRVRLWDGKTGRLYRVLPLHPQPITCLAFSPVGSILATGSHDNNIRFFDPLNGQELLTQPAPLPLSVEKPGGVVALAFSMDGLYFVSAYADRTVSIWDARRLHWMDRKDEDTASERLASLSPGRYEQQQFVGDWYSSRAKTIIRMNRDGTWKTDRDKGKWRLENEHLLWIYFIDGLDNPMEHNRIVSVNENTFLLEELDGNKTTFLRKGK